jgi:hypothetical protein
MNEKQHIKKEIEKAFVRDYVRQQLESVYSLLDDLLLITDIQPVCSLMQINTLKQIIVAITAEKEKIKETLVNLDNIHDIEELKRIAAEEKQMAQKLKNDLIQLQQNVKICKILSAITMVILSVLFMVQANHIDYLLIKTLAVILFISSALVLFNALWGKDLFDIKNWEERN